MAMVGNETAFRDEIMDRENVTISDLISLYDLAFIQLSECAAHVPGNDVSADRKNNEIESRFLNKQASILKEATTLPVRNEEDIKDLLRLWLKELPQSQEDIGPADKLIISLCAYYGAN